MCKEQVGRTGAFPVPNMADIEGKAHDQAPQDRVTRWSELYLRRPIRAQRRQGRNRHGNGNQQPHRHQLRRQLPHQQHRHAHRHARRRRQLRPLGRQLRRQRPDLHPDAGCCPCCRGRLRRASHHHLPIRRQWQPHHQLHGRWPGQCHQSRQSRHRHHDPDLRRGGESQDPSRRPRQAGDVWLRCLEPAHLGELRRPDRQLCLGCLRQRPRPVVLRCPRPGDGQDPDHRRRQSRHRLRLQQCRPADRHDHPVRPGHRPCVGQRPGQRPARQWRPAPRRYHVRAFRPHHGLDLGQWPDRQPRPRSGRAHP